MQPVTLNEIYRQKGEILTQMEILQSRLQMVNQQIQAYLNQPQPNIQTINGNPQTS